MRPFDPRGEYRKFPLPTEAEVDSAILNRALRDCFGYDGRPPTPAERRALEKAGYISYRLTPAGTKARRKLLAR